MGATRTTVMLVVAALVVPSVAHAGGFEVSDFGTVPLGRGGAFTARADTLDAFHYNPAGLSKQTGPSFLVGSNFIRLRSEFQREGSGRDDILLPWNVADPDGRWAEWRVIDPAIDVNTGESYSPVTNGAQFGPLPALIATWGDIGGVRGLAISGGLMTPTGFGDHDWPADGGQRYTVRQGDFTFFMAGVGASYRVNRYFSVGANFINGFFLADFSFASRGGSPGGATLNEDSFGDNEVSIKTKDLFVPAGNIGVLSSPVDWLELGLAVRAPLYVRSEGTLGYVGSEQTPNAKLASAAKVTIRQHFPTVVRAGVRYIHRYFDVEADFVYENYKSLKSIKTTFENPDADFSPDELEPLSPLDDKSLLYLDVFGDGVLFREMNASAVPLRWRDTYSVRLGSDVAVWPGHLNLRAGGFYATSAYPKGNETFSIRFPFTRQVGVGGGFTWHALPNKIDVSVAYQHVFQPIVNVGDDPETAEYDGGIVQAPAFRFSSCDGTASCEPEARILGNVVNNGRYDAELDLFGIAVEGHF